MPYLKYSIVCLFVIEPIFSEKRKNRKKDENIKERGHRHLHPHLLENVKEAKTITRRKRKERKVLKWKNHRRLRHPPPIPLRLRRHHRKMKDHFLPCPLLLYHHHHNSLIKNISNYFECTRNTKN